MTVPVVDILVSNIVGANTFPSNSACLGLVNGCLVVSTLVGKPVKTSIFAVIYVEIMGCST